jgi:hypothetical protein
VSLADARSALVRAVQAATPTTRVRGKPATFKHFAEAELDRLPDARGFYLATLSTSAIGPWAALSSGLPRRWSAFVDLVICYRNDADAARLDEIIASDWFAIAAKLSQPSSWSQSTSTIQAVLQYAPARIEERGEATLLVIPLDVQHYDATPETGITVPSPSFSSLAFNEPFEGGTWSAFSESFNYSEAWDETIASLPSPTFPGAVDFNEAFDVSWHGV